MLIGLLVLAPLAFCILALAFTARVDRIPVDRSPVPTPREVLAADPEVDPVLEALP